jgi:hypothetical protein
MFSLSRACLLTFAVLSLAACGVQRQQQLQSQMDAEYAQCKAGDHDACERYKLLLRQYQTEVSIPRCGLLGLPCPGAGFNVNVNNVN